MATQTTNLHLNKPAYADVADIAVLNDNADIIDEAIGGVEMGTTANTITGAIAEHEGDISGIKDSIGTVPSGSTVEGQITSANQAIVKQQESLAYIVGNTNTTGNTLAVGQFVYVKGHSTITEGLRKVTASISANGNITTSNTSACSDGGLNALNGNLVNLLKVINNISISPNSLTEVDYPSGYTRSNTFIMAVRIASYYMDYSNITAELTDSKIKIYNHTSQTWNNVSIVLFKV